MIVNKDQLQKALEIVKPGLANKEQIEQSTSFAFIKGRVITYNDEISISHPVKGLNLEGAILAENLYKFLTKIKKEEIELELVDNEIVLTSEKAKAGLLLQTEIKLPLKEEIAEKSQWHPLPENFVHDVAFSMTVCTKDMSRPVLTCVHVTKAGYIEASDSYRIVRCDLGSPMPVNTFLLPSISAVEVVKIKPIEVASGRGWVHFKNEEKTIMSCRIFEDKYPPTTGFYTEEGVRVILPKTTEEILGRAQVFSKRDHLLDEEISITIENKTFLMESRSDTGWFKENVPIKYDGDLIRFEITPYLLKGILSETREFKYAKDKLTFRGERWFYASMLRQTKSKKQ
jgi:hypothetical protein